MKANSKKEEIYDILDLRLRLLRHLLTNVDCDYFMLSTPGQREEIVIVSTTGNTLFLVSDVDGGTVSDEKRQQVKQAWLKAKSEGHTYKSHLTARNRTEE